MIGFETIGNATVTVFDNFKPIISTDPWVYGNPYFGSWGHKYNIPKQQIENIQNSEYVWFSHGHPDHLNADSLDLVSKSKILIADHYGDRIINGLKNSNLNCIKLKSNQWFDLSDNVRIKSFSDWNQDSCLLIEISKKDILFNLNDGAAKGWNSTIKNIIKNYRNRFLLKLINWGDADMLNFYDENGQFIKPSNPNSIQVGSEYSKYMKYWNCNYALPFSSLHTYVRPDSTHMNEYVTPLSEHSSGFDSSVGDLLPAFIQWDTNSQTYKKIKVDKNKEILTNISDYGDNWSDQLDKEDFFLIEKYFNHFYHLKKNFGFICFKVGGKEHFIKFSDKKSGIIFETPRKSLMVAVENEIFDDLLIGNFAKTTLVNIKDLYPNFTPYVAKYGDNGLARSKDELRLYFDFYKANSMDFWVDMFKFKTESIIRESFSNKSLVFKSAKKIKNWFI